MSERKLKLAVSEQGDPFTGTWRFNAQRSKLMTPIVTGSPVADTIAYEGVSSNIIFGTRKRNDDISLTETVIVSARGARRF